MRAPAFWQHGGWPAAWLAPAAHITAAATRRRVARPGWHPPVPVFCAGNASMGGAGKTTVSLALAERLHANGHAVHILSRGYGGRTRLTLRVDPARHTADDVGDEPLLLAAIAPCWVGADRAAAARAAIAAGATVLVMDDGLQNPGLSHRHNALVIDGATGFGNGRLFPAGPLRESPAAAAARCERAILIGPDHTGALAHLSLNLPVLRATLTATGVHALAGQRVHALAGIAYPDKFFATLEGAGVPIARRHAFPDHHRYTERTLLGLLQTAARDSAIIVTTPKDAVRIPLDLRPRFAVAGVALHWQDLDAVDRWLTGP